MAEQPKGKRGGHKEKRPKQRLTDAVIKRLATPERATQSRATPRWADTPPA